MKSKSKLRENTRKLIVGFREKNRNLNTQERVMLAIQLRYLGHGFCLNNDEEISEDRRAESLLSLQNDSGGKRIIRGTRNLS